VIRMLKWKGCGRGSNHCGRGGRPSSPCVLPHHPHTVVIGWIWKSPWVRTYFLPLNLGQRVGGCTRAEPSYRGLKGVEPPHWERTFFKIKIRCNGGCALTYNTNNHLHLNNFQKDISNIHYYNFHNLLDKIRKYGHPSL